MEEESVYQVEITPEAEKYYLEVLEYFYKHHSADSAYKKSEALLIKAISLEHHPQRGRIEDCLTFLGKEHRYLLYKYTQNRSIRIIYFIEEGTKTVYVTDFFPTKMNNLKIGRRNRACLPTGRHDASDTQRDDYNCDLPAGQAGIPYGK